MADLKDIVAAYLITSGALHPYGHVAEGSKHEIPVRVNYRDLAESWDLNAGDSRAQSDMLGGGFSMQDRVSRSMPEGKEAESLAIANAINKVLYMGGAHKLGSGKRGDIERMKEESGNKRVNLYVLASALADLDKARNPKRNWDLSFTTVDGAPGMMYSKKW